MKITFNKNMKVYEVLDFLLEFFEEEAAEYPVLKTNMSIDISLKNDIGQISPNNEMKFSFGKEDYEEAMSIYKK